MRVWPLRGAVLALLLLLGWGVGSSLRGSRAQAWLPRSGSAGQAQRLRVLCTIFPLYDFAKEIGGDAVEVRCLLPPGVDPHEFALSPKDVALVAGSDLIVANGAGLDDFIIDALAKADRTGLRPVECSDGLLPHGAENGYHPTSLGSRSMHEHPGGDPHLWLDPVLAQSYAGRIADAIMRKLEASGRTQEAAAVQARAARYGMALQALDHEYQAALTPLKGRAFIGFHSAFGYLAQRYGLKVAAVWQSSPGREPAPREVGEILRVARTQNVHALFSEPQFSPRALEMIAADARIPIFSLDPVETATDFSDAHYLTIMRQNLRTLASALLDQ